MKRFATILAAVVVSMLSFSAWAVNQSDSMVHVKGGCYQMGDTFGDGESDEKPVHEVCVNDFYIGKYEVTVGEFKSFVSETGYRTLGDGCYVWNGSKAQKELRVNWQNIGFYQQDNEPVACVNWNDAQAYLKWLNQKTGLNYRLPTEAEWEYAVRGGTTGRNYWGNGTDTACTYENVADQTPGISWNNKHECMDGYVHTAPVGSYSPNGFGLYDMMGNVAELCADKYRDSYYGRSPRDNPTGPWLGDLRMFRGGSWGDSQQGVRASNRERVYSSLRSTGIGFRLVRIP